jgi:hypothetical protein
VDEVNQFGLFFMDQVREKEYEFIHILWIRLEQKLLIFVDEVRQGAFEFINFMWIRLEQKHLSSFIYILWMIK